MRTLTDPSSIEPYLTDASNLSGGFADGVVIPDSERDVIRFLQEAYDRRWPVTVAGHGSGLVGGRIPYGGWVLSTERLNRINAIRADGSDSGRAVAQPGVPLGELQAAAASRGLFYPPDPTEREAFLGGTVSTNASGSRSFKYGPTRTYVEALRVVLADGRALALRRGRCRARSACLELEAESGERITVPLPSYRMPGTTKHVAGYFATPGLDAVDLFVGAEGTLGVVTQVELRLRRPPEAVLGAIAFFGSEEGAWRFAMASRARARRGAGALTARALEYFDHGSLALLRGRYPEIPAPARAAIYFEEESTETALTDRLSGWRRETADHGGFDQSLWEAATPEGHERFKAFRRALPLAVNEQRRGSGQPKVGTDMAVPDAQLTELLLAYRAELEGLGLPYCIFGHIGDNHLHANILPRTEEELRKARETYGRLVAKAVALGGTLSAEHGVGKLKRAFLGLLYPPEAIENMRRVKASLDPRWILGQGTLFER